jgi:predicted secreted protein
MSRLKCIFLPLILSGICIAAQAQTVIKTTGTLLVVPAFGEVKHANDVAHVTLMIEEQDKDKAAAASRVNQKMNQGIALVKQTDVKASLKTRGYYTYPVYAEEQARKNIKIRQVSSWRVGQYLELTTANLNGLPKTVAAVQSILALNGLYFSLSEATTKKLDEQRIAAAYQNLTERIAAIAKTMGRDVSDAVLDTVDFEATGAYAPEASSPKMLMRSAAVMDAAPVEEPSFEPGETNLQMRVVAKVRFK